MSIYIMASFYDFFYNSRLIFLIKGTYIQVLNIGVFIVLLAAYISKQTQTTSTKSECLSVWYLLIIILFEDLLMWIFVFMYICVSQMWLEVDRALQCCMCSFTKKNSTPRYNHTNNHKELGKSNKVSATWSPCSSLGCMCQCCSKDSWGRVLHI